MLILALIVGVTPVRKKRKALLGSEEPRMAAGLLEGAVLLERRKEMHYVKKQCLCQVCKDLSIIDLNAVNLL